MGVAEGFAGWVVLVEQGEAGYDFADQLQELWVWCAFDMDGDLHPCESWTLEIL